jgi:hypothetical protein
MNYREYLSSSAWTELRKLAFSRANNCCEFCGAKAEQAHHVRYPRQFENDTVHNLVAVCGKCHGLCHGVRDDDLQSKLALSFRLLCHFFSSRPDGSVPSYVVRNYLASRNVPLQQMIDAGLVSDEGDQHDLIDCRFTLD